MLWQSTLGMQKEYSPCERFYSFVLCLILVDSHIQWHVMDWHKIMLILWVGVIIVSMCAWQELLVPLARHTIIISDLRAAHRNGIWAFCSSSLDESYPSQFSYLQAWNYQPMLVMVAFYLGKNRILFITFRISVVIFGQKNLFYKVLTPTFESVSLLSEVSAFGEFHISKLFYYILKIIGEKAERNLLEMV